MSGSPSIPLLNMRFRVEVDGLPDSGAVEVVFPEARLGARTRNGRRASYGPLVLRRGVTRANEWYAWWDEARKARSAHARTVTVTLLDESGATARRWVFRGSKPAAYSWSSLNALGQDAVIETLELAVGGFEADAHSQRQDSRIPRGRRT